MTFALELAKRIHKVASGDIPAPAMSWAKIAFTDTLGVTLGGANEEATRYITEVAGLDGASGTSLIFGTGGRTNLLNAVLINATASHALDFDDGSGVMGGHPSAPLIAPLLALAADHRSSGMEVMRAYVAGFETEVRFGRGVHFHHYVKGWHPTATLGTFGATAACSVLLKLSVDQTAMALAISASMPAGIKANFGTMTKPLHIGQCARNGLFAALLAQQGFSASLDAFEKEQGFFNVYNGPSTYDFDRILEDWGAPLELEGETVGLKPYPCCGSTHSSIDVALDLVAENELTADMVAGVEIYIHPRKLLHLNNPRPTTGLSGKYSIQYAVARAVTDGRVEIEHFEGNAPTEARMQPILAVTRAQGDESLPDGVEIAIDCKDGRRISRRLEDARFLRRGPAGKPVDQKELWRKFLTCARRAIDEERAERLFKALETVEEQPNMDGILRLLDRPLEVL